MTAWNAVRSREKGWEGHLVPGRTRTSAVNSAAIKVLVEWDFLSYPERYPCQWCAGVGLLGIGWARLSMYRDSPLRKY
jgi:hypothetical protein